MYLCTYTHNRPPWALPMCVANFHVGSTDYIVKIRIMGSSHHLIMHLSASQKTINLIGND